MPDTVIPIRTDLRTSGRSLVPEKPASRRRWAPEKVIYPPQLPPSSVIIGNTSPGASENLKTLVTASPTGGFDLNATKSTTRIIMLPRYFVILSIPDLASLDRKIRMPMAPPIIVPALTGSPNITFSPVAAPPTFPILNTRPPRATRNAIK